MAIIHFRSDKFGYTIVELMVTLVIVIILMTTVGVFFVHLLTIQEKDRQDAYIREKLADICGLYADYLSLGSSFYENNSIFVVDYRKESGGVSFESGGSFWGTTGRVAHVSRLCSSSEAITNSVGVDDDMLLSLKYSQGDSLFELSNFRGDDIPLIQLRKLIRHVKNDDIKITLNAKLKRYSINGVDSDALGNLAITARYDYEILNEGEWVETNIIVTAERIVRLWNQE